VAALTTGIQRERPVPGAAPWDLDQVIEQIWRELSGKVSRDTIQQVVSDVAPRYQDAQILTYVPIFIRQDALSKLTGRK
jgi:hypothetical protein